MTTYNGKRVTHPHHMQAFGNLAAYTDQAAIAAALTTSDKVRFRLPAGITLIGLLFYAGDLDTGSNTLTMNVGWESVSGDSITYGKSDGTSASAASDATAFGSALTDFQTASSVGGSQKRIGFDPLTFNDDIFITLVPAVGANAMAAAKTVTMIAEAICRGVR
jgi:hypothetical protein